MGEWFDLLVLRWVRLPILPHSRGSAGMGTYLSTALTTALQHNWSLKSYKASHRADWRLPSMKIRWRRWMMAVAILLTAYAVVGFWLVPLTIKHQVPRFAHAELARLATIGEVSFNPFTLRLEVRDLRLADAEGTPLLAIGGLAAQMQWKSLVRGAWSFAEIRIIAPRVHLAITPDGRINLAELMATLERRLQKTSTDASLPRLIIERFALEQGRVEVRDKQSGYENNLDPIDFTLLNFSTLRNQDGTSTFSANSEHGGRLRWKGEASVNPIRGSGELTLEDVSLSKLTAYLRFYTHATVATGRLAATLPYRFSYDNGRLDVSLTGARLALRDLSLAREGADDSFARLTQLDVADINADLARRETTVGELRVDGGKLTVRRDAKGEFDLAKLMLEGERPATMPSPNHIAATNNWKLELKQAAFDQMAVSVVDEAIRPTQNLNVDNVQLRLQLSAEQAGTDFRLKLANAALSAAGVALTSGSQTPLRLEQLGFVDGAFDLAARRLSLGRIYAEGAQLQLRRDRNGKLDLLERLPLLRATGKQAAAPARSDSTPWIAVAKALELSKFNAEVEDQGTGVRFHVQDFAAKLDGLSSDLAQPVRFHASMNLREGGQMSAQGHAVPAGGSVETELSVKQLALAPLQPLLSKYAKLNIAGGKASAQGRLTARTGGPKSASLRYVGGLDIAGLALDEASGARFVSWKSVSADKITASLAPNLLEIPELRVVEPYGKLIIENDRSIRLKRLLVPPAPSRTALRTPSAPAQAAKDPFQISIQRLRFQRGKLDFTDLSLRPEFSAKIYELNGVVSGLSSNRDARSQIQLDGRVNEYGLARIRGRLNPFAPRDNTDVSVLFKNVDMASTTPYAMKFAGYKISQGKISLDLRYRVRNNQLQGDNKIVIDQLTLGERVDSPDALKLPLELAIALLKDSNGRIDLGLPVYGDLNNPQFSYGAVIWKAVVNVITKIVTAPFRALGSLFGGSGEKLEAIDFDPGSDRLLPPEREKLNEVAQILSKRAELKLSVPAQYSEEVDGAALKARAVRLEVAKQAGIRLEAGEESAPLDLRDRAVRSGLRELYAQRFGAGELDKQKKAAEGASSGPSGGATQSGGNEATQGGLPIWRRVGRMIQGEPQVADAGPFYRKLRDHLEQTQPLAADALTRLGEQRASAILAALKGAGVDPTRAVAGAPEEVESDAGKPVPLKLELAAR